MNVERRHRAAILACLGALLVSLMAAGEGDPTVSGDPFRGRDLLSEKLCTQCHSVWGHGGLLGPDITTAVSGKSWLDLVGDFWNHTPRMIDAMTERGHAWPTLTRDEMSDLLSYLYYLRLFDEPGDLRRGAIAYSELGCSSCHTLGGKGGPGGGPLDRFSAYPSPVVLAQAMWNAGPAMQREQLARGTRIPQFAGKEMADIQAFIRSRGVRADRRVQLLPLPDPSRGAAVFKAKRCASCHGSGSRGSGPDLRSAHLHRTVAEISGILWNHSYAMQDSMRARGIPFPSLEEADMADLISYLHFLGFFRDQGDPRTGAAIFRERGCASCHGGPEAQAPDLSTSALATDPVGLSSAMWNHAPEMHRLMAEQAVAWPAFEPGDMGHVAAFLRQVSGEQGGE